MYYGSIGTVSKDSETLPGSAVLLILEEQRAASGLSAARFLGGRDAYSVDSGIPLLRCTLR